MYAWLFHFAVPQEIAHWVDSGSWWWTGRPGMLWFMGLQRVGLDWVTELNWTELMKATVLQKKFKNNSNKEAQQAHLGCLGAMENSSTCSTKEKHQRKQDITNSWEGHHQIPLPGKRTHSSRDDPYWLKVWEVPRGSTQTDWWRPSPVWGQAV